jgi:hypothetical protein
VAIDFGTTYSGYAYAFRRKPDEINLMRRKEAGQVGGGPSHKIPTILLMDEREQFHAFGYDARDTYHDMVEEESRNWLYFEKFKMELHSRKELHQSMELEATNGRRVRATVVFSHALRFFRDTCLKELSDMAIADHPVSAADIQWVITVPAIWRQSAKQFMRHAANEAGLITPTATKQLIIALEPEAASIYCRKLRMKECIPDPVPVMSVSPSPSPSTGAPRYSLAGSHSTSKSSLTTTGAAYVASQPAYNAPPDTLLPPQHTTSAILSQPTNPGDYAADFSFGMRYLVADCGGGTVDLTVHELDEGGKLKELYKATGGAWGSMGIDCQFEALLSDIFGEKFMAHFIHHKPISWVELMGHFEAKKRAFNPQKNLPVNISLPFAFIDYFQERTGQCIKAAVESYGDEGVQWSSQGMLRLQPSVMMTLFEPIVLSIVRHISELLLIPELSRIEYLFLVGGFSESPVLQEAIRNEFRNYLRVVIPQDVSLTILKGAVMFGLDPSLVHIRRSTLTYGVGCLHPFIPQKHPIEKRVMKGGREWCTDIFDTFVYADQPVSLGHAVIRSYTPATARSTSTTITLYACEKEFVRFVTDPGVRKVAQLKLELPQLDSRCRELHMSMIFGNTEITVEAVDLTSGQTAAASADFLNK